MSAVTVAIGGQRGDLALEVAFEAGAGITAIVGPSGSGKTSILRAIAGLWAPERGRIALGDALLFEAGRVNAPPHERGVGCVFQAPTLFPHLNVERNIRYGERAGNVTFEALVERFDLRPLLGRMPRHLSGGEARRVALARALLTQPRLMLLDEPLTGLDPALRQAIFPYLAGLPELTSAPALYVTHYAGEVARLAGDVITIDKGRVIGKMAAKDWIEQERT